MEITCFCFKFVFAGLLNSNSRSSVIASVQSCCNCALNRIGIIRLPVRSQNDRLHSRFAALLTLAIKFQIGYSVLELDASKYSVRTVYKFPCFRASGFRSLILIVHVNCVCVCQKLCIVFHKIVCFPNKQRYASFYCGTINAILSV